MKTLYIDCGMGAAGDMLSGALLELMPDIPGTINELNAIGVPGVIYKRKSAEKCGIKGSQFVTRRRVKNMTTTTNMNMTMITSIITTMEEPLKELRK